MRTKVSEQKIKEGKRWRGTSVRYTWHKHIHIVDRLEYALYVSIDGDNNNKKNLNPNNNESSRIITEQYGFKRDIREWSSDGCFFWVTQLQSLYSYCWSKQFFDVHSIFHFHFLLASLLSLTLFSIIFIFILVEIVWLLCASIMNSRFNFISLCI